MSVNTAIVLAGGSGSRMNSDIPKQYMLIDNKPVLFYSLNTFNESSLIDEIILVTREDDIEYCQKEIVEKYSLNKVTKIIAGGSERYLSVYQGLLVAPKDGIVYIHDGARACISSQLIERLRNSVQEHGAVIAAVPSKDTVKCSDANRNVASTPDRNSVWIVQTPQVFFAKELADAYDKMFASEITENITDDSMIMEHYGERKVYLEMGEYTNIKITTEEDILLTEMYLRRLN